MFYPHGTVSATNTDSHSTNSTWEDINAMSLSITPSAVSKLLVLFSCDSKITTNFDGVRFRADLDGASQSESQGHQNFGVASPSNEVWHMSMHWVFEGVSAAAHTIKVQWHDNSNGGNCDITNRRLTVIAFNDSIATVAATANDLHTTDNTWEDIVSLTLTVNLPAQRDLVCLATVRCDPNSLNWEHFQLRFDLDGATQSEAWLKSRDSNSSFATEDYCHDFHTVFQNVPAGNHTVKVQWHDNGTSLNCGFQQRRLTLLWFSDAIETVVASADDTHTSNLTWEPVNTMSINHTPTGTEDIVILYSEKAGGTSANWEQIWERLSISGGATGVKYGKERDSNPTSSEKYVLSEHEVFTGILAATTFIAEWQSPSDLNTVIQQRRMTLLPISQTAGTPTSGFIGSVG